jgi:hypothetical protein
VTCPSTLEEPVTIQPGDRGGRLRASHADRERVIGALKAAFVQGRLTKDEFDSRVAQTLAARTYSDLAALTADIPAGLANLPAEPVQARPPVQPVSKPMSNAAKAGLSVTVALVGLVLLTAVFGLAAFALCVVFYFMALFAAGGQVLYSRQLRRSGGQLPPGRSTLEAGASSRHTLQAGMPGEPGQARQSRSGQPRADETRPDQTRTDLRNHRCAQRLPAVPLPAGF